MTEVQRTPSPQRTVAVTVAGALILVFAAGAAYVAAMFAASIVFPGSLANPVYASLGVALALTVILAWAGLAIIRRWRGWRICAGVIAWGMIASIALRLFTLPPGSDVLAHLTGGLIYVAFAVFVLVAKHRERRPKIGAVFE